MYELPLLGLLKIYCNWQNRNGFFCISPQAKLSLILAKKQDLVWCGMFRTSQSLGMLQVFQGRQTVLSKSMWKRELRACLLTPNISSSKKINEFFLLGNYNAQSRVGVSHISSFHTLDNVFIHRKQKNHSVTAETTNKHHFCKSGLKKVVL